MTEATPQSTPNETVGDEHVDSETREGHMNQPEAGGCPVAGGRISHPTESGGSNQRWWPRSLNLKILRKHGSASDPMGADFDYASAFARVDLDELRADVDQVMTTSQPWWPAECQAIRTKNGP